MKRIGIAASRIAKENITLYNCFVFLLAGLFSFLVFVLSGVSLLLGFMLLSWIDHTFLVFDPSTGLSPVFKICMAVLAVVVGLMNMIAIGMNIRVK